MALQDRLRISLLLLRLGVFSVMIMWTIDKFINPDHAARVFAHFYLISGLEENMILAIGVIQLIVVVAFLFGYKKTYSYGAVLILHAISTLSSYTKYMEPWIDRNLLFFAAWPMLAACMVLFLLRDQDLLLSYSGGRKGMFI